MLWRQRLLLLGAVLSMLSGCIVSPDPLYEQPRQEESWRERPESRPPGPPYPHDRRRDARMSRECLEVHRLRILDLDMDPDPVRPGQAIAAWRITLRSHYEDDCATLLTVYDRDELAGRSHRLRIQPGTGVYTIAAVPEYRFQRQDTCFNVQANVGGSRTPIEAQRTFCVHSRSGRFWSLREH